MSIINVLEVIHGIHFGGAEKVVLQIATKIDAGQFRPIVACLSHGILFDKLQQQNVRTLSIPMKSKFHVWVVKDIIRLVKEDRIDVIHTHTSRTNLLGRAASLFTGAKHVATIQSPVIRDVNDGLSPHRLNAFIERIASPFSDHFVCVSEEGKRLIVERGVDESKVSVINNGAEINPASLLPGNISQLRCELDIRGEHRIVSMIASLRPRKGPEFFIRAIPFIRESIAQSKFLVVGSAEFVESRDYLSELKRLAESLGLSVGEDIVFTGFRNDVDTLIEISDVVVLPSLFGEGLPLTLLEAMAHKKPIVATDTEGNREVVIDGDNGFLVPPKDDKAIAEKIVSILSDPEMCRRLGDRGNELFQTKFTLSKMIHEYEEVFRRLAGEC